MYRQNPTAAVAGGSSPWGEGWISYTTLAAWPPISSWALLLTGVSCRSDFGPDVQYINKSLEHVFSRYSIDPNRLGIAGFSDGASYALSLGLPNGDLFTHIVAFSPGFMRPPSVVSDRVLLV